MYQHWYKGFLSANPRVQHYACHSHYYWPDVTREAMLQYWDDSARHVDHKWSFFFSSLIPYLQRQIAQVLHTQAPEQIVFAPNTHEFVMRLLTCLPTGTPAKVITTDSEFHSFSRQSQRMVEAGSISLVVVPTQPFATFTQRFVEAVERHKHDVAMVFLSQVFFNSGYVVKDLEAIVVSVPQAVPVIIDGYHGFMAVPTNLSSLADRVFYLAGGYKYAQAGEGACFMHVPKGCALRPIYTGWFAELATLGQPRPDEVAYAEDGMRFAGATMDFSALYRMRAVFELWQSENLGVSQVHHYIKQLQHAFLAHIDTLHHPLICRERLVVSDLDSCGHFLTFQLPSAEETAALAQQLHSYGIHTDYRGDRLRFGFALYHDASVFDLSAIRVEKSAE